jgi:hypothetical protein
MSMHLIDDEYIVALLDDDDEEDGPNDGTSLDGLDGLDGLDVGSGEPGLGCLEQAGEWIEALVSVCHRRVSSTFGRSSPGVSRPALHAA